MQQIGLLVFGLILVSCTNKALTTNGELSPTTTRETSFPTSTPSSADACESQLQVSLQMVSPMSAASINVGTNVVWKVSAQGCTGKYQIADFGNASAFANTYQFSKTYSQVGSGTESIKVISLDSSGGIKQTVLATSPLFSVVASGATPVATPSATPAAAVLPPQCTITRDSLVTSLIQPATFSIHATGTATTAAIDSSPATLDQPVQVIPNANAEFHVFGLVSGPGGTGLCEYHFVVPRCQLAVNSVTYNSANLTFTVGGQVSSATIDGITTTLPVLPATSVSVQKGFTSSGAKATNGVVFSARGDRGSCAANYTLPTPSIVNTVVSFWAREVVQLQMGVSAVSIQSRSIYDASVGDFQILSVYADGTETISYSALNPVPGGMNGSAVLSGDFSPYLLDTVRVASVRTATFASLTRTPSGASIDTVFNRGSITAQSLVSNVLTFSVDDPDSGAAYYQLSMCRNGYTCRY